jgi:hypothetical protein
MVFFFEIERKVTFAIVVLGDSREIVGVATKFNGGTQHRPPVPNYGDVHIPPVPTYGDALNSGGTNLR